MADVKCGTCGKYTQECTCAKDNFGAKFDGEKPRWDLMPLKVMEEVVKVLTNGSKKYADDNWKKVPDGERRYFAATLRHLADYQEGVIYDKDDKEFVLAHAICDLIFLLWFQKEKIKIGNNE